VSDNSVIVGEGKESRRRGAQLLSSEKGKKREKVVRFLPSMKEGSGKRKKRLSFSFFFWEGEGGEGKADTLVSSPMRGVKGKEK